jgi:hypothetical protein
MSGRICYLADSALFLPCYIRFGNTYRRRRGSVAAAGNRLGNTYRGRRDSVAAAGEGEVGSQGRSPARGR